MPKNLFGDDIQTNAFGDEIVLTAPPPPAGPGMFSRLDDWMSRPIAATDPSPAHDAAAQRLFSPDSEASAGAPMAELTPTERAELNETGMRIGVPIAALAAAPASGGMSLAALLGAAGGVTGEILAQEHEMDRGAREKMASGRLVAAGIIGGIPLGPAAKGGQLFDEAGQLIAAVPQAIVKRGAFGAGISGGANVIEQKIDKDHVDIGEVMSSAGFGALFGAAFGAVESVKATQIQRAALLELRKRTGQWRSSDDEFMQYLRNVLNKGPAGPTAPAEEGATISQEQIEPPSKNVFGDETATPPAPAGAPAETQAPAAAGAEPSVPAGAMGTISNETRQPNIIQSGPSQQPGITGQNESGLGQEKSGPTVDQSQTWLQGIERNDPQAISDAADTLSRQSVGPEMWTPPLSDGLNAIREAIRAPGPNGAAFGSPDYEAGGGPSPKRQRTGQSPEQSPAGKPEGTHANPLVSFGRQVGEAARLLFAMRDKEKQARGARLLREMLSAAPQGSDQAILISNAIKEISHAYRQQGPIPLLRDDTSPAPAPEAVAGGSSAQDQQPAQAGGQEEAPAPAVNQFGDKVIDQPPAAAQPGPMDALASVLEKFEGSGEIETHEDLVNEVEAMIAEGKAPEHLQAAVDEFRSEQADDRDMGNRGDMDLAREKFVAAVRAAVGRGPEAPAGAPAPTATKTIVDTSPITNAKTHEDAVRIGGEMVMKAKTADEIAQIRTALQQFGSAPAPHALDLPGGWKLQMKGEDPTELKLKVDELNKKFPELQHQIMVSPVVGPAIFAKPRVTTPSAMAQGKPDLVLLGCVGGKCETPNGPVPARKLYNSALWNKRLAYAENLGAPWKIMSAVHGIVSPDQAIEHYDATIPDMTRDERYSLINHIRRKLLDHFGGKEAAWGKTIEVHAGKPYVDVLHEAAMGLGIKISTPMAGKQIGEQLKAYGKAQAPVPKPEAAPKPEPVAPAAPSIEHLLNVPEPDVTAHVEAAKIASRKLAEMRDELKPLQARYDEITKLVVKTTGPRWERGKIKKSAPAGLLRERSKIEEQMRAIRTRAEMIQADARESTRVADAARERKIINDKNEPMVRRLMMRLWMDNEAGDVKSPQAQLVLTEFQKAAAATIRAHIPDATNHEIAQMIPELERALYHSNDIKRAFAFEPGLQVQDARRRALADELSKLGYNQWYYKGAKELNETVLKYGVTTSGLTKGTFPNLTIAEMGNILKQAKAEAVRIAREDADQAEIDAEVAKKKQSASDLTKVITESGAKVVPKYTPTPRPSVAADKPMLKDQRDFIEKALRDAAKVAPGKGDIHPEFRKIYDDLVQAKVDDAAEKNIGGVRTFLETAAKRIMGDTPATKRSISTTSSQELAGQLMRAIEGRIPDGTPANVVIEVPDDGTYKFSNWAPGLEGAAETIRKHYGFGLGPPTISRATAPKLTPKELEEHKITGNEPEDAPPQNPQLTPRQQEITNLQSDIIRLVKFGGKAGKEDTWGYGNQIEQKQKVLTQLMAEEAAQKPYKPSPGAAGLAQGFMPPPGAFGPTNMPPADNPNFTQLPFQLPELVRFYRLLSGGKVPRVVENIRLRGGTALGVFRYKEGDIDSGNIEIRSDLFHLLSKEEKDALLTKAIVWAKLMKEANPGLDLREATAHKFRELVAQAEAEAFKRDPTRALYVLAHEIGHFVDFLPGNQAEATLQRGNILGHIAAYKHFLEPFLQEHPALTGDWSEPLTESEKDKLQRVARKQLMDEIHKIVETITKEIPIYEESKIRPEDITGMMGTMAREDFPEFYDWFARLSRAEKVDLLRKAMKGIVDERANKFSHRVQTGTKTVTETVERMSGPPPTKEQILARYHELLKAELKARGLISEIDIRNELQGVIAWWHGTRQMPAYFRSAVEMFADAYSILINNPAALAKRAPTFWQALNNYMVRKPKVLKLYHQLQEEIKSGAIFAQRVRSLRDSWDMDEKIGLAHELATTVSFPTLIARGLRYELRLSKVEPQLWRQFKDSFNLLLNKQQGPIQRLARKHLGEASADKLLGALKDYLYRQTAVEGFARQVNLRVEKPLFENGLNHEDFAEYLFHNRIVAGDAVETANSQGWSPNTSTQRLEEMKAQLGIASYDALGAAARELRAIYEEGPVKLLEISKALRPELMEKIKKNVAYSPSMKARDAFNPMDEGTIRGLIEHGYGKEIGARIYGRIGYLGDIQSPYFALLKKAEALTKFAYLQIARTSLKDYMLEFEKDQIQQAPKHYNGHALVPKIIDTPTVATLLTMENGSVEGWYIPRAIFETLEQATGTEQVMLGYALKALSPFKAILTELSFGFWPVNWARDLGALGIQMPGGMRALWRTARDTVPAPGIAGRLGVQYPRAFMGSRATFSGEASQIADELLSRMMVISRADPRGEHLGHSDQIDRWFLRANKHPELWDAETKKVSLLLRMWETYKSVPQELERTVKAIGMRAVDDRYGRPAPNENTPWVTMPEWMKKKLVNELAGSPDFNERGRGIAFVEAAGGPIFANAWLRGVESFWTAQKRDKGFKQNITGVWGKFALLFAIPAAAYLLYELGKTNLGMDAQKAEDERDMMRSIPERDKLRGWAIPLGWADKSQKKVLYIVLPFPDQIRQLNAIWRKTLQTMFGVTGPKVGAGSVIQYGGQDLPGQNPIISEAGKWIQFGIMGQNPYDSFRGRNVLDDRVFKAGQGAAELAQQSLSNLTGNMIPAPVPQIPGETPTDIEKFLHKPVVSTLLGRWLRVSNAGVGEQDQAAIQPIGQYRAQLQIIAEDVIQRASRGEQPTPSEYQLMSVEPYISQYMMERIKTYAAGAQGPEVRDFERANNEERAALLRMWMERYNAQQNRLNPPAHYNGPVFPTVPLEQQPAQRR